MKAEGIDRLPSGAYRVRIQIRDAGRKRRLTATFKTLDEAKQWRDEQRGAKATGTLVAPSRGKTTMAELAERFLRDYVPQKRAKTQENYRLMIGAHIVPDLGAYRVEELVEDPGILQAWVTTMGRKTYALGRGTKTRPLSPTTVREAALLVGNMLTRAVRWRVIGTNPMRFVDLPKRNKRDKTGLTLRDAERLLAACIGDDAHYRPLMTTLLYTGIRPGEAARARFGDVKGRVLSIPQSKTEAGERDVDLLPRVRACLYELREACGAGDADLIFTHADGRPVDMHNVGQRVLPRLLKRAGLPRIRLYDLRHSYRTIAREAKVPVEVVSANMGHTDVGFTLKQYGRDTDVLHDAALEQMERYINTGQAQPQVAH